MASTSHLLCDRGVRIPPVVHQRYWNDIYISTKMKFQKYTSSQEVRVTSYFQLIWIEHKFWVLKAVGSTPAKYFQDTLLVFLLFILWGRSSIGRALDLHSRGRGFESRPLHKSNSHGKTYFVKLNSGQFVSISSRKPLVQIQLLQSNTSFSDFLWITFIQQSRKGFLRSSVGRASDL